MSTDPDATTATATATAAAAADDSSATVAGEAPSQNQPASASASENLSEKLEKMNISSNSFSIWPPTQRTRDAVINRLIETLSTSSVLSKRYGSMPLDEASSTARSIEQEAFLSATASGGADGGGASIDEGIEILQVYSKEISKRMLEAVKSRSGATVTPPPETSGTVTSDEADNQSSA